MKVMKNSKLSLDERVNVDLSVWADKQLVQVVPSRRRLGLATVPPTNLSAGEPSDD